MSKCFTFSLLVLLFSVVASAQQLDVRSFGSVDMRRFEARMVDYNLAYMLLPTPSATGANRVVYTTNGGDSWQELPLPNYTPAVASTGLNVHFTSANTVIMVIADRLYYSADAGLNWNLKFSHPSGLLVSCFDGMNAIVMSGYGGSYWISTDGGQQWTPQSAAASQDIPFGCRCKDDQGYLWYSPNASGQTFVRFKFSDQSTIATLRTLSSDFISPDMNIIRSFYAVKEGDWVEGLYDLRRTQDFGQNFTQITPYQPFLIQGYSLRMNQEHYPVFYSLFDSAVVIAWLDDLMAKSVIYRIPDSLKTYRGLIFGDGATQFVVSVAANEQSIGNQWIVQDLKLIRRRGMLLDVAENQAEKLRVYPNPTQDILIVDGEINGLAKLSILDISGRVVFSTTYDNSTVDVSGLQSGVYLLQIENGHSKRVTRFIKQ